MIYIFTALYCEAKPFIDFLHMKKNSDSRKFQLFEGGADDSGSSNASNRCMLLIMGTGKLNAAIAISYLFARYEPKAADIIINIGICGADETMAAKGKLYLCNKIVDNDTHRAYYPDVLFSLKFEEATVTTVSVPYTKSNDEKTLYDMEAAGIFSAASLFIQLHKMFYFKVVSDYNRSASITGEYTAGLIEKYVNDIMTHAFEISAAAAEVKSIEFSEAELLIMAEIAEKLRLTAAMNKKFENLLYYNKLKSQERLTLFLQTQQKSLCKAVLSDKRERKIYFEQILRQLG